MTQNKFTHRSIGFENLFDSIFDTKSVPAYPAYDIEDMGDGKTILSLAIAGFKKEDVVITVAKDILKIEGKQDKTERKFAHNGIAKRNFAVEFPIRDMKIDSASFDNGILSIYLSTKEDRKVQTIEIK